MNVCLEIQPGQYTIVVGPKFAAEVLKETQLVLEAVATHLPTSTFSDIVDLGISFLLDDETFPSDAERVKFEVRYKNAYELDPVFVARKIVSSLKKSGRYEEWLSKLFARNHRPRQPSRSLHHILQLQSLGALLVYVHCDDVLSRAANLTPVLMEDEHQMERWLRGECAGFLHVHGVYSKPETVKLDCELYDNATHPMRAAASRLKEVLSNRNTILLGSDWDQLPNDPLLAKFCENFVSGSAERHSFVFSSDKSSDLPGLPLFVTPNATPMSTLSSLTGSSAALWEQINLPSNCSRSGQQQIVCLLVDSQYGAREISHMMFNAPGVNFALINPVVYGNCSVYAVVIRVLSSCLRELWLWLFTTCQELLLANGLLSIVLQSGTFIWARDGPTNSIASPGLALGDETMTQDDSDSENTSNSSGCSSTGRGAVRTALTRQESLHVPASHSPSPALINKEMSSTQQNKIVKRYRVVKRNRVKNGASGDAFPFSARHPLKPCDDSTQLPHAHGPRNLFSRRCSLPPDKAEEGVNTLALLAERLQHTSPSQVPSYVAIKRVLLSEKFKHQQNSIPRVLPPRALLSLLQEKQFFDESTTNQSILSQRRNSDPGSCLHQRDKTRRRQLFVDENRSWADHYSPVIEKKIQNWKIKRQERRQREFLYMQSELASRRHQNGACDIHFLSPLAPAPQHVTNSLHSVPTTTTSPAPVSTSIPQTFLTSGVNGISSPFMYQQAIVPNNLTTASMLLPAPFLSPYTLMGSYGPLPANTATTFFVPQTALADAQQKIVFIPSASTATPEATTTSHVSSDRAPALMTTMATSTGNRPPFSSLLAPVAVYPNSQSRPEREATHHVPVSMESRKRNNSLPEKLSSLLQSSAQDPDSPPPAKKFRSASQPVTSLVQAVPTFHPTANSPPTNHHHSPRATSSLEKCLLQPARSPQSKEVTDESSSTGSPCSYSPSFADSTDKTQLQLWQFLLELLLVANNSHLIEWTKGSQEYEFQIIDPTEVAHLWGQCTNNSTMNYDKLARGLHYYYSKGIISKVEGKKFTFQYNGPAKSYVQMRCAQALNMDSTEEIVVVE